MVNQFEDHTSKNEDTAKETGNDGKEKNCACAGKDVKKRFEIDPVLLRYRIFFFLFFAGFGTTFPYLGIYFKQIGLSAASVGILAGVRPLIQFISGPFWSVLADKYRARKIILLFSIFSWLVMTVVLAFPRPHDVRCKRVNATAKHIKVGPTNMTYAQKKDRIPSVAYNGHIGELLLPICLPRCKSESRSREKRNIVPRKNILSYLDGNDEYSRGNRSYVKQDMQVETVLKNTDTHNKKSNTTMTAAHKDTGQFHYVIEHNPVEIRNVFIVLLMLIIAGEFLEAPSFIMTDTALLEYLGENRMNYGKTRLWGSIGYGVASFGIGAILDRTHYVYCGKNMVNYTFLFYIFAVFMVIGFFFALFAVQFSYEKTKNTNSSFKEVFKLFCTLKIFSFLGIAWFLGFSHGGIMNFLNWYLEDLGATRFMMGIGTLCRSCAIIFGFLNSNVFLKKFGHLNMILVTLVVYTFSFFGYSLIPNPWYALPIECGQGFCYSISWSASITYLGAAAPKNAEATVQGVLQGVYWGLGTGAGAFVGGAMINTFGAIKSFRIGGIVSAVVVFILLIINHIVNSRDKKDVKEKVSTKLKNITNVISSSK